MAVVVRGNKVRFSTLALVGKLVEEVPVCGELRLHRDDARRRTVVEASMHVVRRSTVVEIPGVEAGGATTRQLAERLGGAMVAGRRGQLTSNFQYFF